MPTYDYLCPNGHRFEVLQSVTADGPTSCPICGAAPVRKAFSAPTIHFKGSGWAKKDRSTASRSASKAASASADGGSGSGDRDAGSDGAGTASGQDKDKGTGTGSDSPASSESKPASGSAPKSDSGRSAGSSGGPKPAAAD